MGIPPIFLEPYLDRNQDPQYNNTMDQGIDQTYRRLAFGMCQSCNARTGEEPHTCPFAEEISNDYCSECNCCDQCTEFCANDI